MFCNGTLSSISILLWSGVHCIRQGVQRRGEALWIPGLRILQMPCPFLESMSLCSKARGQGCLPHLQGSQSLVPVDFASQCLRLLRFFLQGVRWLVSKLLLRVGAIQVDGCEAGMWRMALEGKAHVAAEGLWQSQPTRVIRDGREPEWLCCVSSHHRNVNLLTFLLMK